MSSDYTANLNLRKPTYRDPDTNRDLGAIEDWGANALNTNFDNIDVAVGSRAYTEQNYIIHHEPLSDSINKLDIQLKYASDLILLNRKEVLSPEYANSVLSVIGEGSYVGNMTSGVDIQNNFTYNYYQWLSSEITSQSYDIVIAWKVPETFLNFRSTSNKALIVDLCTEFDDGVDTEVDVILQKDGVVTTSSATGVYGTGSGIWFSEREGTELIAFDISDVVLASLTAGDLLIIRLRPKSKNSVYVKVGSVTIQYEG